MSDRGYSVDLRKRVMDSLDEGLTQEEVAGLFRIGVATVYRWVRRRRQDRTVEPRPHGGGFPRAVDADGDRILRELVTKKADRTLAEYTAALNELQPEPASASSVGRALLRLGLTLKKRR